MPELKILPEATPPASCAIAQSLFHTVDRTVIQRSEWGLMVEQAREFLSRGCLQEGITLAAQCLDSASNLFSDRTPQLVTCNVLLGQLYREAKQYGSALRSFDEALKLCESDRSQSQTRVAILGNIAAIHGETSNPLEAIGAYKQRLALLNEEPQGTSQQNFSLRQIKIETLKELSSLSFRTGELGEAEGFAYQLANVQDRGIERGKTILLLARIYRAAGNGDFATTTAAHAQTELLSGGAKSDEPLVLAAAYRLEARLSFDRASLETTRENYELARENYNSAREKYQLSHGMLSNLLGPQHLSTLLCECDIAIVDMRLGDSLTAARVFNAVLPEAEKASRLGSNDPSLRQYLWSSAWLEHKLGVELLMARSSLKALPRDNISLTSVDRALSEAELPVAWECIFQRFIKGVEREPVLSFLKETAAVHLDNALSRYIQVASSLQNQFVANNCRELATVYDRMSSVHYTLREDNWGQHYKRKAELIRSKLDNRDGGNQR